MHNLKLFVNFMLLMATFGLMLSCQSFRPIIPSQDASAQNATEMVAKVRPGKTYIFKLSNGFQVRMKVSRVENGDIFGNGELIGKTLEAAHNFSVQKISSAEIESITVRKFSPGKTALLTITVGFFALLVISFSGGAYSSGYYHLPI